MLPEFIVLLSLAIGLPAGHWYYTKQKKKRKLQEALAQPFPEAWLEILERDIVYYQRLSEEERIIYQQKVKEFLHRVKVSGGGGVTVTDELLMLTAASAIIPVFKLPQLPYHALAEIILTPDQVRHPWNAKAKHRSGILGMVYSTSVYRHTMFLSVVSLRSGFTSYTDGKNVGIHEFAHVIDAADSIIDGVPAAYIPQKLIPAWKKAVAEEMARIREGNSFVRPYGGTNEVEFFAVTSEMYFENPKRMKKHNAALHQIMKKVYG